MQSKPNASEFARTKLPWLAAGALFLIYLATLNQWVSIRSMPIVSKVTGWDWSLPTQWPLFYLVTLPVRIFPTTWQPIVLNLFAAVCGALAVATLVRSVALLPHDRTDEQRIRQRSADGLLTARFAWAPAVLAAAMLGLQLTMWEHSTAATNETLDLLIFAYLIRCLLEYRLSKNEKWLTRLAVLYGLGVTNNWALIGFFPLFLGALIWIRGRSFFQIGFILRMIALGLTGMLMYLALPLVWAIKGHGDVSFWDSLKSMLVMQKTMIFNTPSLRARALILSLTSIVPVIIMGIRFPAGFGDVSSAGASITNTMFRVIHILFAGVCIWVAFDQQVSPRTLGLGLPFLSFYYLGALAVGYYIGYLMLVFTDPPKKHYRPPAPITKLFQPVIQTAAWGAVVLAPIALMIKNFKPAHHQNGKLLLEFAEAVAGQLPEKPAILLSEDAFQLALIEAWFSRSGQNPHLVINPRALPFPVYHRDLVRRYGDRWPAGGAKEDLKTRIDPYSISMSLNTLAESNSLYYLHPSFGYYFEIMQPDPRGLVSLLKRYPTNTIFTPPLTAEQLKVNETFWKSHEGLVRRAEALTPLKLADALYVASHFSRGLNQWGVDLQRAGKFAEAGPAFTLAISLNTNNLPATINLEYNENKVSGKPREKIEQRLAEDFFGQYRSWDGILSENGPFDVPEYLYAQGQAFLQQSLFRQAADGFARASALDPTNPAPKMALVSALVNGKWLSEALDIVTDLKKATNTTSPIQKLDLISMEAAVYFARRDTNRAEATLRNALEAYPKEYVFYDSLGEMYRASGQWNKAGEILDRQLAMMPTNVPLRLQRAEMALNAGDTNGAYAQLDRIDSIAPNSVDAAMFRIYLAIQEKDHKKGMELVGHALDKNDQSVQALIYKGILHMEMKEDEKAIEAFDKALKHDPQNLAAIRNRAIVNLRADHLDNARADYEILLNSFGRSHVFYYGLGEIAYRKKESDEAIRNFELYLKYAPKEGNPEFAEERKKVEDRLKELKAGRK